MFKLYELCRKNSTICRLTECGNQGGQFKSKDLISLKGRTMAQAVSLRPPTAEAWLRSQVSPCGILALGEVFPSSTSVFPCQSHSTGTPLPRKGQKVIIIVIVITGLHKGPSGCGASVMSAAGPFTTQKKVTQPVMSSCSHYDNTIFRASAILLLSTSLTTS
jgi:hypothetical protein